MVVGIGIDIAEIERIKKSIERFGDAFLNKIFTESELEYSLPKASKYQHLAARFAAKEAISKALATGWNKEFRWKDVEIYNEPSGLPKVKLHGKLKKFLGDNKELKISMSHAENYVACVAILYTKNATNQE